MGLTRLCSNAPSTLRHSGGYRMPPPPSAGGAPPSRWTRARGSAIKAIGGSRTCALSMPLLRVFVGAGGVTRRNMRREERVTVPGPVEKPQPDGRSHRGGVPRPFRPRQKSASIDQGPQFCVKS